MIYGKLIFLSHARKFVGTVAVRVIEPQGR
jgi:hypothetical protein